MNDDYDNSRADEDIFERLKSFHQAFNRTLAIIGQIPFPYLSVFHKPEWFCTCHCPESEHTSEEGPDYYREFCLHCAACHEFQLAEDQ